ncbi:dipeptide epimerase [Paraglaciecola sp. 2405UD69-4]|uniref:dipeptide epimerase n=1 Tax=Paraglaciecola sp. 2405UD69-4 TaxID=3391836 RepID=UPI0039C902B5
MKITAIRFAKLEVPLITPFKTAVRTVQSITDLVVIVETDKGVLGYGSAPATPVITGDTHGSICYAISTIIGPHIIGMDIEDLNSICHKIQHSIVANTSAKAALEIAIYDLWAKGFEAPLYKMLGGGIPQLKTDVTISVDHIDKMLADANLAISQGFDILKIKIGTHIENDISRIHEIYKDVSKRAIIRLDVNQGWTAKQTVYAIQKLEKLGVELELIEQPVKSNDIDGLRYISERITTPIMADESACSPQQVLTLVRSGAADIINIKLMKCAGLSQAIKIADLAELHGIPCMVGCMLEGSISVAAAAHLASAKASSISLIDLDGPVLGQYDPVVGGVDFTLSNVQLGNGAGLGIESINDLQEFTWSL